MLLDFMLRGRPDKEESEYEKHLYDHLESEFGSGASAAGHGKEEPDVEAWSVESLEGRLSRKLLSKSGLMGKVVDKGNI